MFELIRLTHNYSEGAAAVEREMYPAGFRLGEKNIWKNLYQAEKEKLNFSVALLDNEKVVGYLQAWPRETRAEGHDEEVVFVEDTAILPEYKERFIGLLAAFLEQIDEKKYGDKAIEAVARRKTYKFLCKHRRVLEKLGYEIKDSEEFFDKDLFEDMVWIRMLPIG